MTDDSNLIEYHNSRVDEYTYTTSATENCETVIAQVEEQFSHNKLVDSSFFLILCSADFFPRA